MPRSLFSPTSKYKNTKITVDGETFDSQKEYLRYCELRYLLRAGKIHNLERQKEYELIPAYYEEVPTGEVYTKGEKKGQAKTRKICIEKACSYIADFVYTENGKTVVEDVKGYRDPSSAGYAKFVIKRKLMLHKYGIKIREV